MSLKTDGFQAIQRMCERDLPDTFVAATKAALKVAAQTIDDAIEASVPHARTPNHSTALLRHAVGNRTWKLRGKNQVASKVGYAVGKKRGQFPPHGVFHFTGTKPRYTGAKARKSGKAAKPTGKPRRYTGYVTPSGAVQTGFMRSKGTALAKARAVVYRRVHRFRKKQAASAQATT
jgi:hypothetical protein